MWRQGGQHVASGRTSFGISQSACGITDKETCGTSGQAACGVRYGILWGHVRQNVVSFERIKSLYFYYSTNFGDLPENRIVVSINLSELHFRAPTLF